MKSQSLSELFHYVQALLPPGVHVYAKPKNKLSSMFIVIFCDKNHEHKYFEKTYFPLIEVELLRDVEMFNERWNSPLAKAMREEDV